MTKAESQTLITKAPQLNGVPPTAIQRGRPQWNKETDTFHGADPSEIEANNQFRAAGP
jgi:hypothetical protein